MQATPTYKSGFATNFYSFSLIGTFIKSAPSHSGKAVSEFFPSCLLQYGLMCIADPLRGSSAIPDWGAKKCETKSTSLLGLSNVSTRFHFLLC